MDSVPSELSAEERARLARKGTILYGKSCGPGGRGDCAESFAVHHLRLGRPEVVHDLLRFLDVRIVALRSADPDGLLATTEALAARIREHMEQRPRLTAGSPTMRTAHLPDRGTC
jgi:hypothetical protein